MPKVLAAVGPGVGVEMRPVEGWPGWPALDHLWERMLQFNRSARDGRWVD